MCWGCLMLAVVGASACSAEHVSGGSSSHGGAPGRVSSGGVSNNAEGGGVTTVEASASAPGGGASAVVWGGAESGARSAAGGAAGPAVGGGAESGASASLPGAADGAGAGPKGSADGCDPDAFAVDFTRALAKSTAPSGCAIAIEGAPIGKARPISSAALDFVARTRAELPGAFTFTLESCDTPSIAACANVFDKYAGAAGGNLQMIAHPFSETIERCSAGVELSVWIMTKEGITSGMTYCLMGDRGGWAMGYCVFDADVCAVKRH